MHTASLRSRLIGALLLVVAVIHLMPLSGVLGASSLERLYGLTVDDPSLQLLLRHRAVLFGLLGALLIYAMFKPQARPMAMLAAAVSVISFLLLAWLTPGYNVALQNVVWADWVALACLIGAALLSLGQAQAEVGSA